MKPNVVITGLGVVSSLGRGVDLFWEKILSGKNGFSLVTSFDTKDHAHHVGAEIKNYSPPAIVTSAERKIFGRASFFAIDAAYQALKDAGFLEISRDLGAKFGVILGTTFGEAQIIESATLNSLGAKKLPKNVNQYSPNLLSVNVAKKFKLQGPNFVVPTACAAGNYAIAYGARMIEMGIADAMLVGGSDPFSHVAFSGFSRLGVMAEEMCRPFDKDRRGMIVGEGAGMMVIEREDLARQRNKVYARIQGCGFSCDANHMTIPDVNGVKAMMINAISLANLGINDIDYICAHGTGTYINDKTESRAINDIFYAHDNCVPVSSIKSVLGHAMGAASALEAIACCLALRDQVIPATSNFVRRDSECDLDCVPNIPRPSRLKHILSNALAFGGNNASLVLGAV